MSNAERAAHFDDDLWALVDAEAMSTHRAPDDVLTDVVRRGLLLTQLSQLSADIEANSPALDEADADALAASELAELRAARR